MTRTKSAKEAVKLWEPHEDVIRERLFSRFGLLLKESVAVEGHCSGQFRHLNNDVVEVSQIDAMSRRKLVENIDRITSKQEIGVCLETSIK